MNNFYKTLNNETNMYNTTTKEHQEIREFIEEVFGIKPWGVPKSIEKEEPKTVNTFERFDNLVNYVERLEKRIVKLEESNEVLTKTNKLQDSINSDIINALKNIVEQQSQTSVTLDLITELLEILASDEEDIEDGQEVECDCEYVEEPPQVGKWYLTWNENQKQTEAEIRSCVKVDGDKFYFVDCPKYASSSYFVKVFKNFGSITTDMLGKKVKGKNEVGKLYFCHDGDKREGIILYARSSKDFSCSVSEMNNPNMAFDCQYSEEIKHSTLGE